MWISIKTKIIWQENKKALYVCPWWNATLSCFRGFSTESQNRALLAHVHLSLPEPAWYWGTGYQPRFQPSLLLGFSHSTMKENEAGVPASEPWWVLTKYSHHTLPAKSWWGGQDRPIKGKIKMLNGRQFIKVSRDIILVPSCQFIKCCVGNYFLAPSKLLHIKLRWMGGMCVSKKTNKTKNQNLKKLKTWKWNKINSRQISTQLG